MLFDTEAGVDAGMGHLMRCCSLAAALCRVGGSVCYFNPEVVDRAREILSSEGLTPLSATMELKYDVVVVDRLARHSHRQRAMSGQFLVRLSDTESGEDCADLTVQPNLLYKPGRPSMTPRCGGREFILLHPAFARVRPSPPNEPVGKILMAFGGSDPANISRRAIGWLKELRLDAACDVVLGPSYAERDSVARAADSVPGVRILRSAPVLAAHIAACDLAVVSGGTLAYEACALGRPTIVVSQNESQALESTTLARQGAVLHVGRHDEVTDSQMAETMRRLCADGGHLRRLANVASRAIGFDGAMNAAAAILDNLDRPFRSD